jgi:VWFA-related protein
MPLIQARLAAAVLMASCLPAQDTQQSQPLVLKSTTRLVQVSVIVDDNKGKPVADLKKEDFQIKVSGKVQPIRVFAVDSATASTGSSTLAHSDRPLPPNVFTNRLEMNAGVPSGVTIILLDERNTRYADLIYAKAQVVRYLRTLQPGDHIGLYVLGGSLRVLHDYTADSSELLNRLASYKQGQQLPNTTTGEPQDAMQGDALMLDGWVRASGGGSPAERGFYTTDRVFATLRALEFIANHMARQSGRKNLIWVSGGFPLEIGFDNIEAFRNPAIEQRTFTDEVSHAVRAMNDANLAIYPVDARGLMVDPRFDASRRTIERRPALAPPVGVKNQQTMEELASRTGGRAYYNTNDLAKAIHEAVDDSRVTYTLGFYPNDEKFDGKFHDIKVQLVERGGLKLRYRKGYFDLPEEPQDDKARKTELGDAVWSPIDGTALGLMAQVQPGSKPGTLDILVKIDHTAISLESQQDRWAGRLDILFVQKDDRGNQFNGLEDTVELRLIQATYDKLMKEDLIYHKVVERFPSAKVLRIVVRDAASGSLGSVTVPLAKIRSL